MAIYKPIYLTASEDEQIALGKSLEILTDYLEADDEVAVYVRRLGGIIEIRPMEGSLDSLVISSSGVSGPRPKRMSVSCNGEMLEITLDNNRFHVYFRADEEPYRA